MIEHDEAEELTSTTDVSEVSRRGLLVAGTALGAAAALGATTTAAAATLIADGKYEPYDVKDSDNERLTNPERGLYRNPSKLTAAETLVEGWLYLNLVCGEMMEWHGPGDSRNHPVLQKYEKNTLQVRRRQGVKIIFRPRYDVEGTNSTQGCKSSSGVTLFHPESMDVLLNHIDAVGKMLRDYRDVIGAIHAGYLGCWGEWNTAADDPKDPTGETTFTRANAPFLYDYESRRKIVDRILLAYGGGTANRVLQPVELRTPLFAWEARLRNIRANIRIHNDCFMSTVVRNIPDDYGTYLNFPGSPANVPKESFDKDDDAYADRVRRTWMDRAKEITKTGSFGGETCGESQQERWRNCANMIDPNMSEPKSLRMNYLNQDHEADADEVWGRGMCLGEIRRRLGYRFELRQVDYPTEVTAGQTFTVTARIANTGWARLHKPRRAQLFLVKESAAWTVPFPYAATSGTGATQNWAPGSTPHQVTFTGVAPSAGKYRLHLAIFDPDAPVIWNQPPPSDPNKREEWRYHYAVKLATKRNNVLLFNQATGMNDLGVSITVRQSDVVE